MLVKMLADRFKADGVLAAKDSQITVDDDLAFRWIGDNAAVDIGQAREALQGTLDPVSGGGPAFLWANANPATIGAGNSVRITDVGHTEGGSVWLSDGTKLVPLNGMQVLFSNNSGAVGSPLGTGTALNAKIALPAAKMASGGSIVLPPNFLRVGQKLRVSMLARNTGATASASVSLRLGTLNTVTDNSFATCQLQNNSTNGFWGFSEAGITGATGFLAKFQVAPNGAAAQLFPRSTNFDITQQMYLGLYVASITAPDTIEQLDLTLEIWG